MSPSTKQVPLAIHGRSCCWEFDFFGSSRGRWDVWDVWDVWDICPRNHLDSETLWRWKVSASENFRKELELGDQNGPEWTRMNSLQGCLFCGCQHVRCRGLGCYIDDWNILKYIEIYGNMMKYANMFFKTKLRQLYKNVAKNLVSQSICLIYHRSVSFMCLSKPSQNWMWLETFDMSGVQYLLLAAKNHSLCRYGCIMVAVP